MAPERAAARRAVESLRLIPVMFELGARPHPARALYRAYLAQSHVFVGLYFERYGWVAPGETVSGLEDEYLLSGALPRLVYVKEQATGREERLERLLDRVRADDTVAYKPFRDAEELGELLRDDLAVLLAERFLGPRQAPADTARAAGGSSRRSRPPRPTTSLVGRDEEVAEVEHLLADGERLVSLVGPGGIGKTRLALEVAQLAEQQGSEVTFVPLEDVTDPAAVLPALAAGLGVGLDGTTTPLAALRAALAAGRRDLVLLDNVEQVVDAGPDLVRLLEAAPGLTLLATSRVPLRLRAEHQVLVGPLRVPEPTSPGPDGDERVHADADVPAVRLFLDRAEAANGRVDLDDPRDNTAVAELVRRLDGIPLAIEMAAARTRILPPAALLQRVATALDLGAGAVDLPPRQRTLRDTVRWSEQLLPQAQRRALARLSVLPAPWSLDDALALLTGAADEARPPADGDPLEAVAGVVEASLAAPVAAPVTPRFRLYEPVRGYAREQLADTDRDALRSRMVGHFAAEALRFDLGIRSPDHERWLTEFRLVWPSLRQAWDDALALEDLTGVAHLTACWVPLWLDGRTGEIRERVDRSERLLLAAAGTPAAPSRTGDAVLNLVGFAFNVGDFEHCGRLVDGMLRGELPSSELPEGEGTLALYQAYLAAAEGDLAGAGERFEHAAQRLEAAGPGGGWIAAYAHSGQGSLRALEGDLPGAVEEHRRASELGQQFGNVAATMQSAVFLAAIHVEQGELDSARELLIRAATLVERQPFYEGNAYCVEVAAAVALADGHADRAVEALGLAGALRDVVGARVWPLLQPVSGVVEQAVRAAVDADAFARGYAAGHAQDPRSAADVVRGLLSASPALRRA